MERDAVNRKDICRALVVLGDRIGAHVRRILRDIPMEDRVQVVGRHASDVTYALDREVEGLVIESVDAFAPQVGGITMVAEGIGEQEVTTYPESMQPDEAAVRLIVDPLDGTRGLMVAKRSAFFLAGVAPNRGESTRLSDLDAAVMVEIPTHRAFLRDALWAIKGEGMTGETRNLLDGRTCPFSAKPSREITIRGGFAQVSRFFPPGRDRLAALEEQLLQTLFPDAEPGEILTFEDQYISTGGQLYELLTGKDRFTADLRATLYREREREGKRVGHICHPYDLAGHLIGAEAGILVTDAQGQPLDAPLDTTHPCDWIGYANQAIKDEVAPVLRGLIQEFLV